MWLLTKKMALLPHRRRCVVVVVSAWQLVDLDPMAFLNYVEVLVTVFTVSML